MQVHHVPLHTCPSFPFFPSVLWPIYSIPSNFLRPATNTGLARDVLVPAADPGPATEPDPATDPGAATGLVSATNSAMAGTVTGPVGAALNLAGTPAGRAATATGLSTDASQTADPGPAPDAAIEGISQDAVHCTITW